VRKSFSESPHIKPGTEIISINSEKMDQILNKMYPQISAERLYFKNAKVEVISFPRLYWQVYGKQDQYELEFLFQGKIIKESVPAVRLIEDFEMKRTEVLSAQMKLMFLDSVAYLNPGDFGGDEHKFQQFIDSSFQKIREKDVKNLVIDLRNNKGGDNAFSDYMVSYFANKPFQWNSSFTIKTSRILKNQTLKNNDTTSAYFKAILHHEDGAIYPYYFEPYHPQPLEKRFTGQVYVLVNRQSHSQSAVTAAQIQDYKFGTIVGEETGDYPSLYASQFQYPLPRTGIPVKVSKGYMVRVNGSEAKRGVIPDIVIKDHLLDENDEILAGLLDIIKQQSRK